MTTRGGPQNHRPTGSQANQPGRRAAGVFAGPQSEEDASRQSHLNTAGHFHARAARAMLKCGIAVMLMRFHFDERRSTRLRANPKMGIGFEEVQEVFSHPCYLDQRSDSPEQPIARYWVGCIPSFLKCGKTGKGTGTTA